MVNNTVAWVIIDITNLLTYFELQLLETKIPYTYIILVANLITSINHV